MHIFYKKQVVVSVWYLVNNVIFAVDFKKQIIMNKDNLLLMSNGDDSKGTSADIDFNMWLLEFLDRKV